MDWNRFCLFSLMCFSSPLTELNIGEGWCSFYQSDDVNKKSLVIDPSKVGGFTQNADECLKFGPYNTILIHAFGNPLVTEVKFLEEAQIKYDHLILIGFTKPSMFCEKKSEKVIKAISLTVLDNNDIGVWEWLECTSYKYIRIENCRFQTSPSRRYDELILSEHLLTLTLVNDKNLGPWAGFRYYLAPNLRELTINGFKLPILRKKLPESSFPKLKRLNLRNNQIDTLFEGIFDNMPLLEEIILEGNRLKIFSYQFKSAPKNLYLDGNPLSNDEKTCQFLKSAPFVHYRDTGLLCGRDEL